MKERLKLVWNVFTLVTTFQVLIVVLTVRVFRHTETVSADMFVQIPIVALLCGLSCLFLTVDGKMKKKTMILMLILHYLSINAIVLICGYFFDWYNVKDFGNVCSMVISIAIIYCLVTFTINVLNKREAKEMNDKLKEYQEKGLHH